MKRNYKQININFNLDDEKDVLIYEFLMNKRAKSSYLKDLVENDMDGTVILSKVEPEKICITNDELDDFFD